jgi:hypothetical protein
MRLFFNHKPKHRVAPLQESSTDFGVENLRPFLERVAPYIEAGFGEAEINRVVALANIMAVQEEQNLEFAIRYDAQAAVMTVRLFMDDIACPSVYFFSPPKLAEQIDREIQRFFDELGI